MKTFKITDEAKKKTRWSLSEAKIGYSCIVTLETLSFPSEIDKAIELLKINGYKISKEF